MTANAPSHAPQNAPLPEILAPAGSRQSLEAAVFCGANAVYLGMKQFGARAFAENFGADELCDAVRFAHGYGVKIYVTLNTLLYANELRAAAESLEQVCAAGADGIIVQDMAMLRLAREAAPKLHLHASTQMSVHSLDGALLLAEQGVSRVVLARELTLKQIEYITSGCREAGVDTEVFVHGALCFSASGQCYLSGALGGSGRCGNRGSCAQPCRLPFSALPGKEEKYALSLKDMSCLEHLDELKRAGVASLKIEGRMKRPEYVAASVTAAREALAGRKPDMQALAGVFSRSGFTDGYLTGNIGGSMFGTRRREDVEAASGLLGPLRSLYSRPTQLVPVDVAFSMRPDMPARFEISDGERVVCVESDAPQPAQNRATGVSDVEPLLRRLGGTPFYLRNMTTVISDGLNIPISQINDMRRSAAGELLRLRSETPPVPFDAARAGDILSRPFPPQDESLSADSPLWARFECAGQLFSGALVVFERVILPAAELLAEPQLASSPNIVAELPRIAADLEYDADSVLDRLTQLGVKRVLADGVGMIRAAQRHGMEVIGGMGLNVVNPVSAGEYFRLGLSALVLSHETPLADARRIGAGMTVYGHLPLTISKNCPIRAQVGCKNCTHSLTDRLGRRFPVLCGKHRGGYARMLNPEPVYLADRAPSASFRLLFFTVETAARCGEITRLVLDKLPFDGKFTRGGHGSNKPGGARRNAR